jgi:putative transposase
MLGLSRWAGTGGSSRTVPRLCSTVLPWAMLLWGFFRHHLYGPAEVYGVAGDEGIVTQAGKPPHGLARCFSSWSGKPGPGRAFCTRSLGSVQTRRALPRRREPVVRSDAEQAASKPPAAAKKPTGTQAPRRPGRPQGSKTTPQAAAPLTPALGRITGMRTALLPLLATVLAVTALVLAGHLGTHNARPMARQGGLHLMATLRYDAAL